MTAIGTLLVVFSLCLIWFLVYAALERKDKKEVKRLLKDYDEKKDLSKQGERNRQKLLAGGNGQSVRRKPNPIDDYGHGQQEDVQIQDVSPVRKTSVSKRKTSNRPRGIFRKLRR